jgi:hypothetical protein
MVLKKSTLIKVFVKARLFDTGNELNEFETIIINKYGAGKHSFSLEDINEVMVLYGSSFFPQECSQDPRFLISIIFKSAIIPYVERAIKVNSKKEQSALSKLLQDVLAR